MRGSLTVEASYIFPFCFLVIGIVCYLGILQYDRAVLKMTAYECIFQTIESSEKEQWEEMLLKNAEEAAKKRVLGTDDLCVSVKISATKISLTYEASYGFLKDPITVSAVYERIFPELTLRMLSGKTISAEKRNGSIREVFD